MIAIFISFIAGIITTIILYLLLNNIFLKSASQELLNKIEQAEKVKKDLEDLMEISLELSKSLIQDLERNLEKQKRLAKDDMLSESQNFSSDTAYNIDDKISSQLTLTSAENLSICANAITDLADDSHEFYQTNNEETKLKNNSATDKLVALQTTHPYIAVKTLLERGYSIKQIAQELNRGQGEVNLIISLLNKKIRYSG